MKKKLLWICIPTTLIIVLVCFVYFDEKSRINSQDSTTNEDIQDYTFENDDSERNYLLFEECYNEYGELNNNPELDDNGNIINCYNKNGNKDGKQIYYNNGQIKMEENYKDGLLNGKSIIYDESGNMINEGVYINGKEDGEHVVYWEGEWWQKFIFENGEILDIQENPEISEKIENYYENKKQRSEEIWNKFESGEVIDKEEFKALVDLLNVDYILFYDDEFDNDFSDVYRRRYKEKTWELLALYSMMNCGEDYSNPDTYLFNLEDPKLAQEIYFKNCPKGCRYADEEDVDFMCE